MTWALVGFLIRIAPRVGLLDRPNERSLHTRVTPRGGGLGIVLAVLGVAAWGTASGRVAPGLQSGLTVFLGAAWSIAAVSLWDDFRSLGAGWRFLSHIAAAGAAVWFIGPVEEIALPWIGVLSLGSLSAVLTVVWIVGLTNVYNFMDGIDGIAGTQGLIAGLAWAVVGFSWSLPAVTLLGLVLAGGCLGFLIHNWAPARIFMGDVGSAFLGYCFAVLPLIALREAGPAGMVTVPGFALLVVWPFLSDGFVTFIRRARRLEPVWKAHRSHLYQKLVRTGWSHAQVSGLYGAWCGTSATTGLLWIAGAPGAALITVVVSLASLAGIYLLAARRERGTVVEHD